jgi:uncharacterized protein (TIGR03437 family)
MTDRRVMKKPYAKLACLTVVVLSSRWSQAASTVVTPSPTSLSFSYTVDSTTLPASTKLTITLPSTASSSTVISVTPVYPTGTPESEQGWLTVAPASGYGPLALTVLADPTSLPPGSFSATLSVTTDPDVGSVNVPVTLAILNPPANLVVTPGPTTTNFTAASGSTPATLSFTYVTGAAWTSPASELDVSTNGGIIPFNVTVANASASGTSSSTTPVWLRVAPQGAMVPSTQTSGVAVAGASVPIMVSLDQTTVENLLPGSYGGTATFAATSTANGTEQVAVNLVISAGAPAVTSIFPTSIMQAPTVNPLITINGQNFFSTSVVTVAPAGAPANNQCTQTGTPVQVSSTLLSQNIITATISNATTLFANPGSWCICVSNPAPPNAPNQVPACTPTAPTDYTFNVVSSSQVSVSGVSNAASYQQTAMQIGTNSDPVSPGQTSVAPGEIVSIFGENLGPGTPSPATPSATPAVVTSSAPLAATLDTTALATTLQFTVTSGSGSTPVTVNFGSDPNVALGESLANIVAYINQVTTADNLGNMASLSTALGNTYITLTSPTSGSAAGISVTDNTAAELLNLTNGSNVTVSGTSMAFPLQFDGIQVGFQFTNTQTSALTTAYAPIIMVSANQINAMVPMEVVSGIGGGGATLIVQNGSNSAQFNNLVLVNEDPGIFTINNQGFGQAAVLNYNPTTGAYTINSSKNTASLGSTIVIYATGMGTLSTPLQDGVVATTADKVSDPVQVTIGGQPCVVAYAGTSPGSIGGLTQINAIVPPTASTGQAVALTIAGGTAQTARQSQTGVTLAIK